MVHHKQEKNYEKNFKLLLGIILLLGVLVHYSEIIMYNRIKQISNLLLSLRTGTFGRDKGEIEVQSTKLSKKLIVLSLNWKCQYNLVKYFILKMLFPRRIF